MRVSHIFAITGAVACAALFVAGCSAGPDKTAKRASGHRTIRLGGIETNYATRPGSLAYVHPASERTWSDATVVGAGGFEISTAATKLDSVYVTCAKQPCGGTPFLRALDRHPPRTVQVTPCARATVPAGTHDLTFNVRVSMPRAAQSKTTRLECSLEPVG